MKTFLIKKREKEKNKKIYFMTNITIYIKNGGNKKHFKI
jgi:hypothetical protein